MNTLAARARQASGLSQGEVARRAGTSRPTLSAYEHGQRNPTLDTLERVLAANGQELIAVPKPQFAKHEDRRGRPFYVPDQLPRLSIEQALATVVLPVHVDWSSGRKARDLANRKERNLVYRMVLAEGLPEDILQFIDGTLLADAWPDIHLPSGLRQAWQPLIDRALKHCTA